MVKLILSLDTSDNQKTIVKLNNKELIKTYSQPGEQRVLEVVDELLKKEKISPQNISAIQFNPGPGSYTSLRVGCAVANAMSWALGIKVNGKNQVMPVYGQ